MRKLFVLTMVVLLSWSLIAMAENLVDPQNKEAHALQAQKMLEALQQGASQQAEATPAQQPAQEDWRPQYGPKGEITNAPPIIYLNGQSNIDEPISQGIITSTLLFQNFNAAGWTLDNQVPLGGWTIADSGSEGTNIWHTDDWHKFFYQVAGWYDTVLTSNWSTVPAETLMNEWLITPAFDLSSATSCSLYFKQYYDNQNATRDSANVMVSTNNGSTWARVNTQKIDSANPTRTWLNIGSVITLPNPLFTQVKIAFWHFYGATGVVSNLGWVVDSITVRANSSNMWVQDFSNVMSGWYGNTPPSGPGGAWTILDNGIAAAPKATNANDWNRRAGNLLNDTVASVTYTSTNNRRERQNEWLFSPGFTIGSSLACTLSLAQYWALDNQGGLFPPNTNVFNEHGYIRIQESTDAGATWGPWSIVADNNNVSVGGSNIRTFFKYDLNAWRGKYVRLSFNKVAPPEASFATWYIDDVKVDDYIPAIDNVGTMAITSPIIATQGRNMPVMPKIFNNGLNAETFQDSTSIAVPVPGATIMSTGFENGGVIPAGWTDSPGGLFPWLYGPGTSYGPGTPHSGSYAAYFNIFSYAAGTTDSLISPSMDLSSLGGLYGVEYWGWHTSGTDSIRVYLDQSGVKTYLQTMPNSSVWTKNVALFSSTSTNAKIYFIGYSRYGSYNLYIDDVAVYQVSLSTVYLSSETVTAMPALSTQVLTYASTWNNPAAGTYILTSWTSLVDSSASDNSKTANVTSYAHTGAGGPDAGGYTFKDDITGGGGGYNWIDISSIGAPINFDWGTTHNRYTRGIALGFPFFYYGAQKSRIFIGEDGYITFDSLTTYYNTNYNFPYSSAPNNLIALFWDDLMQSSAGNARFWSNNIDTAIVSFTNWAVYASIDTAIRFDAQVILSKADGKIKMQYRKFAPGISIGHSIGIENAGGTAGLQYVYNGAPMGNLPIPPLAITFNAPMDDIAATQFIQPAAAWLQVGGNYTVQGKFKNNGAVQQTFDAVMVISTGTTNVYYDTVLAVVLNAGDSTTLSFDNFVPATPAAYAFTMSANNPGDEVLANNTLSLIKNAYQHDGIGGPDAFYYRWMDNTVSGGPAYGWIDTTGFTAVSWLSGLDDTYARIPIGNPFYFYGHNFDRLWASTNGLLTFDSISASPTYQQTIPSTTAPRNLIDFVRHDMMVAAGLVKYTDDTINNRFIISYDSCWFYSTTNMVRTQIILNRNDSSVTIQYREVNTSAHTDFCVGVEDSSGTIGLPYYYSATLTGGPANLPYTGLAIKFAPWHPAVDAWFISHQRPAAEIVSTPVYPAVTVKNNGSSAMTLDVKQVIVGPFPSTAVVFNATETTPVMAAGSTAPFAFTLNSWTPAATGSYTVYDSVLAIGEEWAANNYATKTCVVVNSGALPVSADFEASDNGFVGLGDWQWGVPRYASGPDSTTIPSPFNLWGTNLTGLYTNGQLNSLYFPAVPLTGGYNFKLTFNLWLASEAAANDGANLKISSDNGVTWSVLTTSLPYDGAVTSTTNPMFGQQVWGGNKGWTEVISDVSAWTGQTIMLRLDQGSNSTVNYAGLYIDNASLVVILADIGVASIDEPPANPMMAPGSYTVKTTLQDYTPLPTTFDVFLEFDGVKVDSMMGFFLNGNSSQQVTWPTSWVATPGSHTITAFTVLAIDANSSNDSKSRTFNVIAPVAVPFTQNFDGVSLVVPPAGWTNMTLTGSGLWANSTTKARSLPNSAYCNYFGGTNKIWLVTPPIDLSTVPGAKLSFYEDQSYWSASYQCHHSIMVIRGSIFGTMDTVRIADWTPSNHPITGFIGAPVELGLTQFNGETIWIAFSYESSNYADAWYLDDISLIALPTNDVGVSALVAPISSPVQNGGTYDIVARILNIGASTETFDVTAVDDMGFTNTQAVTDLAPFATVNVTFPGWTFGTGCDPYLLTITTGLVTDTLPANDVLSSSFTPVDPGNTSQVYDNGFARSAWRFLSPSDIIANRFETISGSATLTSIAFKLTNRDAWPTWPNATRDSVVSYIFIDADNNGSPDAAPIYIDTLGAASNGWTVWPISCQIAAEVSCQSFWAGWAQLDSLKPEGIIIDSVTNFASKKWIRGGGAWSLNDTYAGDNMIRAYFGADAPTPAAGTFALDPVVGDAIITRADTAANTLDNTGAGCDLRYSVSVIQELTPLASFESPFYGQILPGSATADAIRPEDPNRNDGTSVPKGSSGPTNPPMTLNSGGPDAFGYKWKDSAEPGGPVYSWVDISSVGTPVTWISGLDDGYTNLIPMGMTFNYYGTDYSSIAASTNGFASLLALTSSPYNNLTMPTTSTPNALLAAEWDDHNGTAPGICYYYHDVAQNRFIISWVNWSYYSSPYDPHNFQIILNGSDKSITYQYGTGNFHSSSTVGIENATGTVGLQVAYNQVYLHTGLAVKFFKPTWLSTDLTGGILGVDDAPRPFDVIMDASSFGLGVHNGAILLTSNNPTQPVDTLPVTFTINSVIIGVAPSAVAHTQEYGTETDYLSDFTLSNTGTGTLLYTAANTKPWITLSSVSGSVAPGGSLPFDIHVNTAGLLAGVYTDSVTFTSNDPYNPILRSPRITITVTAPNIGITPATLSVTQETDVIRTYVSAFAITNTGSLPLSPLNWTASNSLTWLTLSTTSGTVPASGNQLIDLTINTTGIVVGLYADVIHIASNDPDEPIKNLPVAITVSIIGVNPNSINTQVVRGTQMVVNLTVGNGTGVPTSIDLVAAPAEWLSVAPLTDTIPAHSNVTAQVTINATDLDLGVYHGSVTITSSNFAVAVVEVPVDITVVRPPIIGVNPASITHVQESDVTMTYASDFTISNTGDVPLNWTANSSLPWITPMTAAGTVSPAGSRAIDIRINTAGITPGVYPDVITIASNDPATPLVELPVTVTVAMVAPSWDHLDINVLEGSRTTLDLDVNNGSAVDVGITLAAAPADWLTISPGNDTIPAHSSITAQVTIDAAHLPFGNYNGMITLTSSNIGSSLIEIPVNLTIGLAGCDYISGDANNSRTFNGLDVTYSVVYFKGGDAPPYVCECTPTHSWFVAGDVNGSCSFNGLDVTYMVNYFKGGTAPMPCPDCPSISQRISKTKIKEAGIN